VLDPASRPRLGTADVGSTGAQDDLAYGKPFAREQGRTHHHDRRDPARPGAWAASQLTIDPADRQGMWKHTIATAAH
jgi:hypothetical protein